MYATGYRTIDGHWRNEQKQTIEDRNKLQIHEGKPDTCWGAQFSGIAVFCEEALRLCERMWNVRATLFEVAWDGKVHRLGPSLG